LVSFVLGNAGERSASKQKIPIPISKTSKSDVSQFSVKRAVRDLPSRNLEPIQD